MPFTEDEKIQAWPLADHHALYEWVHRKWPEYFDCRPIYVEKAVVEAGFNVRTTKQASLFGLPLRIVIASKL